jgi:hypothetical protein
MSRVTAVLGSALFFVIAPLTIAGLIPFGCRGGACSRPSSVSPPFVHWASDVRPNWKEQSARPSVTSKEWR